MATAATLHATPAHQQQQHYEPSQTSSQTTLSNAKPSYTIPRGPTETQLTFYGPPADGSAPYNYVEKPPEGVPQRNYTESPHKITVNDVRGSESSFNLDTHGFLVRSDIPSSLPNFDDEEQIKKDYYREVENLLLQNIEGSEQVYIFDHTIRRTDPNAPRGPVNRVHIDQTASAAAKRVERHMGSSAEKLLQGRYRIVNVWRPLNGPVVASPLAFAASDSVPDTKVVPVQHRYPDRTGETAGIEFSEGQKWYYWSGMGNEERIFLQCFDSAGGGRVPHTAFTDSRTPQGAPGRESIEVRALVFG